MTSDSFAQHFAQHIDSTKKNTIRTRDIRAMVKMDIIWQGDPISCMKTFGTNSCKLCMKERLEILHRHRADPSSIINSNNEIYGACRHKTKFHRYIMDSRDHCSSTDEGRIPKNVTANSSTSDPQDDIQTILSDLTD